MELQDKHPIPPRGVLIQSLNEANGRIRTVLGRYMTMPAGTNNERDQLADNSLRESAEYVYTLRLSPRKGNGKAQAITDLLHSYMVNAALTRIFSSVNVDLSARHEAQTAADVQSITSLLHQKLPPV